MRMLAMFEWKLVIVVSSFEAMLPFNRGQTQKHAQCTRTRSPAAKISLAKILIETIAEPVLTDVKEET